MPPAYVKPYVKRQKNDATDAEAICEAVTRANMRFVETKTPEQQSCLMLHCSRQLFIRQQTSVINAIRAHMDEFGIVAPVGRKGVEQLLDIVTEAKGESRPDGIFGKNKSQNARPIPSRASAPTLNNRADRSSQIIGPTQPAKRGERSGRVTAGISEDHLLVLVMRIDLAERQRGGITVAAGDQQRQRLLTLQKRNPILGFMSFKRNQVEEAVARGSEPRTRTPSTELRTKLKRLLEMDRKLGCSPRASDPGRANYAFFSGEARGSGVEVWFSEYEAFALFTALRLLEHGLPQKEAVSILRQARPRLEPKHAEIMQWDPKIIFDKKKIWENWRPGMARLSTTRPVFLTVASRKGGRATGASSEATWEIHLIEIPQLARFLLSESAISSTLLELVRPAHDLRNSLMKTTPVKRGRGSS